MVLVLIYISAFEISLLKNCSECDSWSFEAEIEVKKEKKKIKLKKCSLNKLCLVSIYCSVTAWINFPLITSFFLIALVLLTSCQYLLYYVKIA